jgi:DNA-binding IclR family transcriptional regulator
MLHRASQAELAAPDKRQNVKSLFKMLDVLECFSASDRELSVIQMAQRTGLPRTTVHRIVESLRSVGFLEREASRERYRLGLKLFELGNTAITNLPLYRESGPFVETLAKLSGETVHLCVFNGFEMVFVEHAQEREHPNNTIMKMEATPCHSTGVGKAALAFQPQPIVDRIIGLGLRSFTQNTITDPERLLQELAKIRDNGYATDDNEHELDRRCVAAPIRNASGKVFAAISVTGKARRFNSEHIPKLAELVMSHARLISVQLGFHPDRHEPSDGTGSGK